MSSVSEKLSWQAITVLLLDVVPEERTISGHVIQHIKGITATTHLTLGICPKQAVFNDWPQNSSTKAIKHVLEFSHQKVKPFSVSVDSMK